MHGNADGTRLIRQRTRNRLPNPPGGVGRKLITAVIFELIHRLHQPDVAFLNEIQKRQTAIGVFFRDTDHETQVRLDHLAFRFIDFADVSTHRLHPLDKLLGRKVEFVLDGFEALLQRLRIDGGVGRTLFNAAQTFADFFDFPHQRRIAIQKFLENFQFKTKTLK